MSSTFTPSYSAHEYAPNRIWRWLAALAVLGNIFLNYYSNAYPFNGQSMGTVSGKYPTLLTPAGYAFSIWGLIFLSLTVYVVWQLLPTQRTNPLPDVVAQPLTLASIATALWVVLFAYERILPCWLAMMLILGALVMAYGRARRLVLADVAPRWVSVPFALYLGWISVAFTINSVIGLRQLGWQPDLNLAMLLGLVLLTVVVGLGLLISREFKEATFPLVVAWALVAIWMAQRHTYPELSWAALIGAGIVGLGGLVLASGWGQRMVEV